MELGGLHHVTAVTAKASLNRDFYTQVLGMRLVKKSVNQDVISTYHLFYADEIGTPGTDMTFFDWPQVPANQRGYGEVAATGFMVPEGSLDWWTNHLDASEVVPQAVWERNGYKTLAFEDFEGQRLELVEGGESQAIPWSKSLVPVEHAIRGLASVTLTVPALGPTISLLEDVLGFRPKGDYAFPDNPSRKAVVFEAAAGGLGTEVHVEARPDLPGAQTGIGGVHHVAFRTTDEDELQAWRHRVAAAGFPVTEVIDRYYFRSIYFREPGGVLYEIATDGPGFSQDEDIEHLGEHLSLPPFLESKRSEIEAQLQPL